MAKYIYEPIDENGRVIKGTIEAEDLYTFKNYLKVNNLYLLKYKEKKGVALQKKGSIKYKDLIIITKEFSAMLNAGISLVSSLEILHNQATNKKTKDMYLKLYIEVQKGVELSESMANLDGVFSEFMINMIRTGEESGTLALTMETLSSYYEKEVEIGRKVRAATIYPAILSIVTFIIIVIIFGFVMPSFTLMFEGLYNLPWSTRLLIHISNAFVNSWHIIAIGLIVSILACISIISTHFVKEKLDKFKLDIPIIGNLLRKIMAARFCYTMSSMLNSGLNIILALEISAKVLENSYLTNKIEHSIDDIKRGMSLSESLKKLEIFPAMMISMINIGEESGDTEGMMEKTSSYYEGEAENAIKDMISLLEPIMIIILGVIISFVIISIMVPLYDMYQTI